MPTAFVLCFASFKFFFTQIIHTNFSACLAEALYQWPFQYHEFLQ